MVKREKSGPKTTADHVSAAGCKHHELGIELHRLHGSCVLSIQHDNLCTSLRVPTVNLAIC